MVNLWAWAVVSNERAVANAREAAVECSRRRLEVAEVHDYLRRHAPPLTAPAEAHSEARVNQR